MRDEQDRELVEEALARVADIGSNREAARLMGVSEGTVRLWRARNIKLPLRSNTRESLRLFLGGDYAVTPTREVTTVREAPADYSDPFAEWLRDLEQTVRLAGGKEGFDAEERRNLQKDIVNLFIDARRQRGAPVPPQFYELLGRVERGELG